jgi:hypothetical protein
MDNTATQLKRIYWTKDAFSLNYSFYDDGKLVGFIRDKGTERTAKASAFGIKYVFEKEGIFRPHINIIDLEQREEIGRVDFKVFRARANVRLRDRHFLWRFTNALNTKWALKDESGQTLITGEKRKEGHCRVEDKDTMILLITSLILRNHYTKQGY